MLSNDKWYLLCSQYQLGRCFCKNSSCSVRINVFIHERRHLRFSPRCLFIISPEKIASTSCSISVLKIPSTDKWYLLCSQYQLGRCFPMTNGIFFVHKINSEDAFSISNASLYPHGLDCRCFLSSRLKKLHLQAALFLS